MIDLIREIENEVRRQAEQNAAMAWSTPSDDDEENLGDDVIVVASFDMETAVNGDILEGRLEIPSTHEFYGRPGGDIPVVEDYAYLDHVARKVVKEFDEEIREWAEKDADAYEILGERARGLSLEGIVDNVMTHLYGPDTQEVPVSVSGEAEYYVNKKVLREIEA